MKKSWRRIMWLCFISMRIATSSNKAASSSSDSFLRFTHFTAYERSLFDRWKPSRTVENAPVPSFKVNKGGRWEIILLGSFPSIQWCCKLYSPLLSIDKAHRSASHSWRWAAGCPHVLFCQTTCWINVCFLLVNKGKGRSADSNQDILGGDCLPLPLVAVAAEFVWSLGKERL